MRRSSAGFTLIELMVTVAILGLLATFAFSAYTDYIREAKSAKVIAHYRVAVDQVRLCYGNAHVHRSQGLLPNPPVPTTSAEWIDRITATSASAPSGGPAFIAGAGDAISGAIGIASTGTWATEDSSVTVTRPAFAELATESVTITQQL